MAAAGEQAGGRRGPGRPRKWADDAERARAYRARRAAELAEPERLRAERRKLEGVVRKLRADLEDERRGRQEAERRAESLASQVRHAEEALAEAEGLLE